MSRASPGCSKTRQLLFYTHRSAGQARTVPTAQHTSTYYNSPLSRGATRTRCGPLRPPGTSPRSRITTAFKTHALISRTQRRSSAGDAASFATSMMLVARNVQHARCLRRCSARPTKRSSPWCVARQRNRCVGGVWSDYRVMLDGYAARAPTLRAAFFFNSPLGTSPLTAAPAAPQKHLQSLEARARWRIFSVVP